MLFSPLSISQSIALLKDGATIQSENESELSRLLGPPSLLESNDSTLARILHSRSDNDDGSDADVQLQIATSIWADKLKSSYIESAKSTHLAEAFPLPTSYSVVNQWVANKTHGLITKVLDEAQPVDQSMVGLLVNTVYFRGMWSEKFNAKNTVDGEFFLRIPSGTASDKGNSPAKYMRASREMEAIPQSTSLGGASVLVLDYGKRVPYGPDKRIPEFSSIFILPASSDVDSMNDVISGLDSRPILDLLKEVRMMDVRLKLPRFRLNFGPSSLKPSLKSMGIKAAFNPSNPGMFRQMSDDPKVHVGDMLHGATMEVSEEGTVAAAVTVTTMRSLSASLKPPPLELTYDRPFVVVVVHRPSGMPLFIGRVENPELIFTSSV